MEPRHYLAALIRRWPTLAILGMLGLLGSGIVTVLTPPTYTSTTALLFSVQGDPSPGEVRQDAQYVESTITSLIGVTRSTAVLGPVVAEEELGSTTELAETLTVVVVENTTILEISVARVSAEEAARIVRLVSEQLQVVVAELTPGVAGPSNILTATTIEPPTEPRFQTTPDAKRNALLGAVVGLMAGVIVALYRESVNTRINSVRDVAVVTDLPVWPIRKLPEGTLGRLRRFSVKAGLDAQGEGHSEDLRRLGLALGSMPGGTAIRSISVQSTTPRKTTQSLATGLADVLAEAGQGVELLEQDSATTRSGDGDPDVIVLDRIDHSGGSVATTVLERRGVLAVVEAGRTRRRTLESLLSAERPGGSPFLGVVLAGQSPDFPVGIRAALRRLTDPAPAPDPARRFGFSQAGSGDTVVARSTVLTAVAALFLAGMDYGLPLGTNPALVVSAALAPVWITALPRYRYAPVLLGLAGGALVYGLLLADWSSVDHAIDGGIAAETSFRFLGAFGTVGLILWARTFLTIGWIGLCYGLGALLTGLVQSPGSPNPWKFELAFGATIIVLALVTSQRRTTVYVAAMLALGLVSVLLDYRSWFAFCAVAAALVLWQARPRAAISKPASRVLTLLFLAALGVGGYAAASFAIVEGYLGDELQARSVEQIQTSGSLIAGGRPEWTVTWVLMQDNPMGFGVGVVPNSADILAGGEGFATVDVPFQSGYVEFLFGGRFKLHSVFADFWSNFGVVGIVLGMTITGVMLAALSWSLTRRCATPLGVFLVIANLWNLAFQPIYSSLPSLGLMLGVVLLERRAAQP